MSNREAKRFKREFFDTPHLLLGLLKEGNGVAFHVLTSLGIDLPRARLEVGELVECDERKPDFVALTPSPSLRKVVQDAFDEADELGHHYVGTEHLLLGLLREPDAPMTEVLEKLGLKSAVVRQEVLNLLGHCP